MDEVDLLCQLNIDGVGIRRLTIFKLFLFFDRVLDG